MWLGKELVGTCLCTLLGCLKNIKINDSPVARLRGQNTNRVPISFVVTVSSESPPVGNTVARQAAPTSGAVRLGSARWPVAAVHVAYHH
jgi:hypothetical protein